MVSPIFLFYSSSSTSFLLPTSLDKNELSIGVSPLGNLLSSKDIISFFLRGSSCKKEHMFSSSGKTCQDSTLFGK
jgi:hypothetical protein